jgi:quinol monooxygenase YgiN
MGIDRRTFIALAAGAAVVPFTAAPGASASSADTMHGLIGKMTTQPGQRDAFIAILLEGIGAMPGCLSYVVAKDPKDPDGIWITEVWDSEASHKASLSLPAVKAAIARGRPLIAGFGEQTITAPVGGHGLGRG